MHRRQLDGEHHGAHAGGQGAGGHRQQIPGQTVPPQAALLDPLAEACIKIGGLVMATGFASDAFQKSITNPYAAIAAGAALIAVGAIAKAGMNAAVKNVGSGGGYSTSVASSAYTSNASNPSSFGREMEVKVTGTLTANGSQLVAVLNNEHNRNSYTT